jgi:hypothetical protein
VNNSGQTVKGVVSIAASQSVTSTTYTTLSTPDQITGIVVPANGLLEVSYTATWAESVSGAGRAAIFIDSNQITINGPAGGFLQAAATGNATAATSGPLFTSTVGLVSTQNGGNVGGAVNPIVGGISVVTGQLYAEFGGVVAPLGPSITGVFQSAGGACLISPAAGTHTVSVQFRASSGNVSAALRTLRVRALSFA